MTPLVTIVSPLYNAERHVEACMNCVLTQDYDNWLYFVIDNASTDKTGEIANKIAQRDSRIRVVTNPETVPVIPNHNVAVAQAPAETKYLRILQADDRLETNCVSAQVAVAEQHPSVGMVGSQLKWGDDLKCDEAVLAATHHSGADIARRTLSGEIYPFWSPSCILFRWDAIKERAPFYNEDALHSDLQAAYEVLRDWDFGFVSEVLSHVGKDEQSVTATQTHAQNKLLHSNLDLFLKYGPEFLAKDAFDLRLQEHLDGIYAYLGWSVYDRRDASFWDYHRATLNAHELQYSRGRVVTNALQHLLRHPKSCAYRLRQTFK